MNNPFDAHALEWDKNPATRERSIRLAEAIRANIPITNEFRVLDYGCATGELLLALQPYAYELVGVDTSSGMIDRFLYKIQEANINNIRAQVLDFGMLPSGEFDLIICSMVMHHIPEPVLYLRELERILRVGGYVVIVDLAREDGTFHGKMQGVFHHGFTHEDIRSWLEYCYLKERLHEPSFYTIAKREGEYPVTFTIAQK